MEKFTMVNGTALHYTDTGGGGRPVILLHGYLESLEVWDDFSRALSGRGFRVVTLDLPGHGISEVVGAVHTMEFLADTVAALAEKIGADKPVLLGHSMGGYVALAYLKKYPHNASAIILFSSTPNADTPEKKESRRREIALIEAGKKEMLARITPPKGFAEYNRARLSDLIADMELQVMLTEDEGIAALLEGMAQREDMNDMLKNLPLPQLFVFGRGDEYITPETAEKIIAANPQADVAWLERSGHNGFLEQPEESLGIVSSFISAI